MIGGSPHARARAAAGLTLRRSWPPRVFGRSTRKALHAAVSAAETSGGEVRLTGSLAQPAREARTTSATRVSRRREVTPRFLARGFPPRDFRHRLDVHHRAGQ